MTGSGNYESGVGENEQLGAPVPQGRKIAPQEGINDLKRQLADLGHGLLVLMAVGGVVVLAGGLDVVAGPAGPLCGSLAQPARG